MNTRGISILTCLICGLAAAAQVNDPSVVAADSALEAGEPAPAGGDDLLEALREYESAQYLLMDYQTDLIEQTMLTGAAPDEGTELNVDFNARFKSIRAFYEALRERYPDNARIENHYAELLYDEFYEMGDAVMIWEKLEDEYPGYGSVLFNLALHYNDFGDYDRSLDLYERLMEVASGNPDYLFALTQFYLTHFPFVEERYGWSREKLAQEAMALSRRASELAPDDYELAYDYAINFFSLNDRGIAPDWSEAAAASRRAAGIARSDDDKYTALMYEARAWLRAKDVEKANTALDRADEILPGRNAVANLRDQVEALGEDAHAPVEEGAP